MTQEVSPSAARRVVVLGASNVTRGAATLFAAAHEAWGGPLDMLIAAGHGRSYGRTSNVMGRVLPPIIDCGLWTDWERRAPLPTAALITDIGNDILYGVDVPIIAAWIADCLDRLAERSDDVVLVELPLHSVARLRRETYLFFRTLLFPRSRMTLSEAVAAAEHLNDLVRSAAAARGMAIVQPNVDWYGFDPIHVRRHLYPRAWSNILSSWQSDSASFPVPRDWRSLWAVAWGRPEYARLLGIELRRAQPAVRLRDGSTVSFY